MEQKEKAAYDESSPFFLMIQHLQDNRFRPRNSSTC